MKVTKAILKRTIWLGRGTATVMGLAMLLALTVGLASTALAGTGVGARFDLGRLNAVNAASTLVGNVNGPVLTVKNRNGTSPDNVPLSLETTDLGFIPPPPMKVDSTGKVDNLNVDLLDGKSATAFASSTNGKANDANLLDGKDSTAFFSGKTYAVSDIRPATTQSGTRNPQCDAGDAVLSGGFIHNNLGPDDVVVQSSFDGSRGWLVIVQQTDNIQTLIGGQVLCADFPPLR